MESESKSVLIVGAGGLGVPAASALVRARVRRLGIIDPDPVELSNLPRQVIYEQSDIGTPKVMAIARHLKTLAPGIALETYQYELDQDNAADLIASYDFVIDATDSPIVKFLINDTCIMLCRPYAYGGVLSMIGQAMTVIPGLTACLRCIFEAPPEPDEIASCRDAGIIGPIAGAIGEVQAAEAVRYLRGSTPTFAGAMLTYDASGLPRIRLTPIAARPGCGCGAVSKPSVEATR